MKKKWLACLLAAAISVSGLTGCGSKGSEAPDGAESGSTAVQEADGSGQASAGQQSLEPAGNYSAENPYHLTFTYIEFYEQDANARMAVQDAMNEKLIPKLHMEVELLPLQFAEYQNTIQLMLSGGDALDVMPVFNSYAASWINMGGVYDMNEFMDTAEGQAVKEALGEKLAYAGSMNGVLYGFPANKEYVELGGLCMRADICDELGITEAYGLGINKDEYDGTIYDWSVAGEIFAKVKEAYPDMVPFYLNTSSQMNRFAHFDVLSDSFGVLDWEADNTATRVVNKFETDTYKNVVTMLADWYDKGYIYKDAQTDTSGSAAMMKAGNTFSYATGIKPGFLVEAKAANGCDCYALYFGNGVEAAEGERSVLFTSNACLYNTGISTNSGDPAMGNQFISYVWNDGSKTSDYWNELEAHNAWGDYSPTFGFMWDSTEYSTELTALNNAFNTYRAALETGSIGSANMENTLDQLNRALYAAGLQNVMDAKQEQLDQWLGDQK